MKRKEHLVIVLPESLVELPVRIIRGSHSEELIWDRCPSDTETVYNENPEKRYAFIWRQNNYLKVELDEIQWIEADGSYSIAHLTGNRCMMVSFGLSVLGKDLPTDKFVRIHRSHIVNLKHIGYMEGNGLVVGNRFLPIGREYREMFFSHFIFIGVRRSRK